MCKLARRYVSIPARASMLRDARQSPTGGGPHAFTFVSPSLKAFLQEVQLRGLDVTVML